jgi:hypothetical protein
MLMNYAQAFAVIAADIEKTRAQVLIDASQTDQDVLNPEAFFVQQFRERICTLLATCQQVAQLDRMTPPLGRMLAKIDGGMTCSDLHHTLEALQLQLFDELDRIRLYHVVEPYVPLYENPTPFGQAVFDNFPSANSDALNAGRCLALGQSTASVFHLMRVMEVGLRALSKALDIPYAPSWESHLKQIKKQIESPHKEKTRGWKAQEAFYKDAMGDLEAIKLTWRNPTMHIVKEFDDDHARMIYLAVGTFMSRLATRLKEPRRPASPSVIGVVE